MNEMRVERMVRELEGPPPDDSPPRPLPRLSEGSWVLWALVLTVLVLAAYV